MEGDTSIFVENGQCLHMFSLKTASAKDSHRYQALMNFMFSLRRPVPIYVFIENGQGQKASTISST